MEAKQTTTIFCSINRFIRNFGVWLWLRNIKFWLKIGVYFFENLSAILKISDFKFFAKIWKLLSWNNKKEEVQWDCCQVWAIRESKKEFVLDLRVIRNFDPIVSYFSIEKEDFSRHRIWAWVWYVKCHPLPFLQCLKSSNKSRQRWTSEVLWNKNTIFISLILWDTRSLDIREEA